MSLLDQIRQIFNEGDYLGANKLQQDNRITDCRDICQNLTNIESIASMVDDSIASISALENQIKSSKSNTLNIKDKVLEMEQKETAVEVQCKNLDDICALIDEISTNLYISDHVERVLLHGNLDDESHIEHIEDALNELDRVLSYKTDPTLLQMQCVRVQRERANTIKSRFLERFHQYFEANYYNKQNGIDSLGLLMRLSRYISIQKRPDSFLSRIYGEVTINVKRNFDKFMATLLTNIRDYKPPKQSKLGVLIIVKEFEHFANEVEQLFDNTGRRRPELDRWYPELVTELFRIIDTIEHNRTPTEMIRLENYKYLHDLLCSIKVSCLKPKRAEAKQQYEAALNAYVARYFGRPLEKVNIFFDGVQAKVAQGVKEEEIGFQLAFSKQELRRVLQMVTLKEVRKGLEEMYRRIEKHAFEPNSNLIEVIWHAMQSEFLSQYKAIQNMIERCYPSSNLSLTFTIDNVLQVFSDIAQSH